MKQLIKNTTINICQQELVNKKLEKCKLVYDASSRITLVNNDFSDCKWLMTGNAVDAFKLFNELLKFGAIKIIDGQMVVNTGE